MMASATAPPGGSPLAGQRKADAPSGDVLEVVGDFLQPSMELLTFYRSKIVNFEAERSVYLQRLADLEGHIAENHRLRWELSAREEEVRTLQDALHDAKLYLYDERHQLLTLQSENEALKAQEVEDRARIQHLLAMTQPVMREVTFFRDAHVPAAAPPRPDSSAGEMSVTAAAPPASAATVPGSSAPRQRVGAGVIRTAPGVPRGREGFAVAAASSSSTGNPGPVSLSPAVPATEATASASQAQQTIASLRQQLEDARRLHDERIQAFGRDRDALKADCERKAAADTAAIRQLEKQLQTTSEKLAALTRDYLLQRYSFAQSERQAAESVAMHKAQAMRAEAGWRAAEQQAARDVRSVQERAATTERSLKSALQVRAEESTQEAEVAAVRHQAELTRERDHVSKLQQALALERRKYTDLQTRRAREIEGFNTDIAFMRKAMKQLERQWALVNDAIADQAIRTAVVDAAAAMREALQGRGQHIDDMLERNQDVYPDDVHAATEPVNLMHAQHVSAQQGTLRGRGRRRSNSSGARSRGSSQSRGRSRSHSASGASSTRWGGLAMPLAPASWRPIPAAGAAAVADPGQRSRLKGKKALLHDHAVLYRTARSSGYGQSGRGTLVDPVPINRAAVASAPTLEELYGEGADESPQDTATESAQPELVPRDAPSSAGTRTPPAAASTARPAMSSGARRVRAEQQPADSSLQEIAPELYVSGVTTAAANTPSQPRSSSPVAASEPPRETDAVRAQLKALRDRIRALDAKDASMFTKAISTSRRNG